MKFKARRFHSSCTIKDKVYVYGGCHDEYQYQNFQDVIELDFTSFIENPQQTQIFAQVLEVEGDVPVSRWGHSASVYDDKMFIFGGWNTED